MEARLPRGSPASEERLKGRVAGPGDVRSNDASGDAPGEALEPETPGLVGASDRRLRLPGEAAGVGCSSTVASEMTDSRLPSLGLALAARAAGPARLAALPVLLVLLLLLKALLGAPALRKIAMRSLCSGMVRG